MSFPRPGPISDTTRLAQNGRMKTSLWLLSFVALAVSASAQGNRSNLGDILRQGLNAFAGNQQQGQVSLQQVTANWNDTARSAAKAMYDKYGAPQEVTTNRLVWHDNRPWKTTAVVNQEVQHNFPVQHNDVLVQTLAIDVPADRYDELAQFDGSIVANRTAGELTVACDKEENNFIALNLAADLVNNRLSLQQARQRLVELVAAAKDGQRPSYATDIRFSLPVSSRTGDPDRGDSGNGNANNSNDWRQIGW